MLVKLKGILDITVWPEIKRAGVGALFGTLLLAAVISILGVYLYTAASESTGRALNTVVGMVLMTIAVYSSVVATKSAQAARVASQAATRQAEISQK